MATHQSFETGFADLRLVETIIEADETPESEWFVEDSRTWCGQIILARKGRFKITRHDPDRGHDHEAETVGPGEHTAVYRIGENRGRSIVRLHVLEGPVLTWCLIYPTKRYWPQMEQGRAFGPYDREQIFFLWEGATRVDDNDLSSPAFITLAPGRLLTTAQESKFLRFEEDEARWQKILEENPPL